MYSRVTHTTRQHREKGISRTYFLKPFVVLGLCIPERGYVTFGEPLAPVALQNNNLHRDVQTLFREMESELCQDTFR